MEQWRLNQSRSFLGTGRSNQVQHLIMCQEVELDCWIVVFLLRCSPLGGKQPAVAAEDEGRQERPQHAGRLSVEFEVLLLVLLRRTSCTWEAAKRWRLLPPYHLCASSKIQIVFQHDLIQCTPIQQCSWPVVWLHLFVHISKPFYGNRCHC